MESLDLGLGATPAAIISTTKYYKGKVEYAGPFYTINIAHVDYLPEYEVIGVNGEVLQIRRGEDVQNITACFVQVLKDAITSHLVTKRNADQTEYHEWVPRPAIPYQIVEGPYQNRKDTEIKEA